MNICASVAIIVGQSIGYMPALRAKKSLCLIVSGACLSLLGVTKMALDSIVLARRWLEQLIAANGKRQTKTNRVESSRVESLQKSLFK